MLKIIIHVFHMFELLSGGKYIYIFFLTPEARTRWKRKR